VGAQSVLAYDGDLDVADADPELLAALRADIRSAVS